MSEKEMLHFWFSYKQEKISDDLGFPIKVCKIGNTLQQYTMCHDDLNHGALWDDMQYLGKGYIYSVGGVVQNG